MAPRVLVIGGDAAGMTAASAVNRLLDDVEVVVLERGTYTSYSACGVPYWVAGDIGSCDDLVARTPEEHRRRGIDVRLGATARSIDVEGRTVRFSDAAGEQEIGWDRLVVATGARSVRPDLPGIDARGIHTIKDLDDGHAVLEHLAAGARDAVVVGSGYIGIEMVEAFAARGLRTTVLERDSTPLPIVEDEIGAVIAERMSALGVRLVTGAEVTGFGVGDDGSVESVRTDDQEHPADIVVAAFGVTARSELLPDAAKGAKDGLVTDEQQRVRGMEGVWSAGDCVVTRDRLSGGLVHLPLGTHANKQGLVAGESIAASLGATWSGRTFQGTIQSAVTKLCDLEIARTGLGVEQARDAGFDPVVATIETTTRAGYYPGAQQIHGLGVADRASRRLLGVQLAGGEGTALRIDTAAMALWSELGVDELVMTDLPYAPPFSSVWSPAQVLARALTKKLAEGPESR
ncbi:FAD-dependent oxidoreductase [Aeromicrobium sp. CTD01-1L150]|uniref:FAD-dependent oxidoreductase n=1 Tax=Aeromicrobium sp. CTD01-1L150 TaxID=3341830 RepID=UPI0035BF78A8